MSFFNRIATAAATLTSEAVKAASFASQVIENAKESFAAPAAVSAVEQKGVELFARIAADAKIYGVELVFVQAANGTLMFRALTTDMFLVTRFFGGNVSDYAGMALTCEINF